MHRLQVGIHLESLGLPFRQALVQAARCGVHGVQFDAAGDLSPRQLSQTGLRELRNLLRSHDLELTALGCPLRHGLDTAEDQQPRIEHVQRVMVQSYDLGARVVVVESGPIPEAEDDPHRARLRDALGALARHGDRIGVTLALDAGLAARPEAPELLRRFLDSFDTAGLGINLDPASLLMNGHEPCSVVRCYSGKIVHAQARDALRSSPNKAAQEVPLGHGDIDWLSLLAAFEEAEVRRWLVVKRHSGDQRLADVQAGVQILRRLAGVG